MIKALRGMEDIFAEKAELYMKIIATCRKVAENFSYSYVETPKLEESKLFIRSVGESSDIVGKEMYRFIDKGENDVCLRPEGTAGLVRAFIEHKLDRIGAVERFYYFGSMFRYEKPQKGRLREFHQFGLECFCEASVYEDANIILLAAEIFKRLGIKNILKINSLALKSTRELYKEKLGSFLENVELCEDCQRRSKTNPLRVFDCKNEACQEKLKEAPFLSDNLDEESKKDFELLQKLLKENGLSFEIDKKLVRGLDYYSKTAFEFTSDEIGSQSAICGGGRYDDLVEELGGKSCAGVGFGIGIERLMEILSLKEEKKERKGLYICVLDEAYLPQAFALAQKERAKNKVLLSYDIKKISKQIAYADKKGFLEFLCLGEDEIKKSEARAKNLETKEEKIYTF